MSGNAKVKNADAALRQNASLPNRTREMTIGTAFSQTRFLTGARGGCSLALFGGHG
jgi:hypothetical protein